MSDRDRLAENYCNQFKPYQGCACNPFKAGWDARDAECAEKDVRIKELETLYSNVLELAQDEIQKVRQRDAEIARLRRALEKMPCESRFETLFVHDPDCIKCAALSPPRQPGGEGVRE